MSTKKKESHNELLKRLKDYTPFSTCYRKVLKFYSLPLYSATRDTGRG